MEIHPNRHASILVIIFCFYLLDLSSAMYGSIDSAIKDVTMADEVTTPTSNTSEDSLYASTFWLLLGALALVLLLVVNVGACVLKMIRGGASRPTGTNTPETANDIVLTSSRCNPPPGRPMENCPGQNSLSNETDGIYDLLENDGQSTRTPAASSFNSGGSTRGVHHPWNPHPDSEERVYLEIINDSSSSSGYQAVNTCLPPDYLHPTFS